MVQSFHDGLICGLYELPDFGHIPDGRTSDSGDFRPNIDPFSFRQL
jgi:hypothetical protein